MSNMDTLSTDKCPRWIRAIHATAWYNLRMSGVLAIFLCISAQAVDGDTLRCANVPEAGGRVRLARVDAPERGRQGAKEATQELRRMLQGPIYCDWIDAEPRVGGAQRYDRFGRRVAICRAGAVDIGASLLRRGLVGPWPKEAAH